MKVSIHEDYASVLVVAETHPQFTPTSKHYASKKIWFRKLIVLRGIKLLKIDTIEQLGDMLTKELPRVTFEYMKRKLLGE